MRDLLFLVPLALGLGIMVLGMKLLKPHESPIRRILFAASLVVGSICWAVASAINLVWDHTFYVALDLLTICIFFLGCLCLLPKRTPDAGRLAELRRIEIRPGKWKWWLDPVILTLACGLLLGLAHGLAMVLSDTYPARLIAFYQSLGITASKQKTQPAPNGPAPRPVPTPSPFPNLNPTPPR